MQRRHSEWVDAAWYLTEYPDVAAAGLNPYQHFAEYGRREGRWPHRLLSVDDERLLWSPHAGVAEAALKATLANAEISPFERSYAAWALGQWLAHQGRWQEVYATLAPLLDNIAFTVPGHSGPLMLFGLAAVRESDSLAVFQTVEALRRHGWSTEAALLVWESDRSLGRQARLPLRWGQSGDPLSRIYIENGLVPLAKAHEFATFDDVVAQKSKASSSQSGPLISVIVPFHNAARTLQQAVSALLAQTYRPLELVFVDDGSTDESSSVLQCSLERHVLPHGVTAEIWRHNQRMGPYAARNTGFAQASGAYLTVHDADDWSHPQKIERQLEALAHTPGCVASISCWARMEEDLRLATWFPEPTCVHRNISSLMLRREAFDRLGYWDRVEYAGDSEYMERLRKVYGETSIIDVMPHIPLSFGRVHSASLTRNRRSDMSQWFWGPRAQYVSAFRRAHAKGELHVPYRPSARNCGVPESMISGCIQTHYRGDIADMVEQSAEWDGPAYFLRNPDTRQYQGPLVEHYLRHGALEGRDPGSQFSTSGYSVKYRAQSDSTNPLVHYLLEGKRLGYKPCPEFEGQIGYRAGKRTVLLVGHQSLEMVFGAERCLVDTAAALSQLGFNVVVTLPTIGNLTYLAELRAHSAHVHVVPDVWWRNRIPAALDSVNLFRDLIGTHAVDLVFVNTVVQDSAIQAARSLGIPVIIHVHELLNGNPTLCSILDASPEKICTRTLRVADTVIANSRTVAEYMSAFIAEPLRYADVVAVPNAVRNAASLFSLDREWSCPEFVFTVLGSNSAEKGLDDVVSLARRLRKGHQAGHLLKRPVIKLFGGVPCTDFLTECNDNPMLFYMGYVESPETALHKSHALLSLSRVSESFGRSVAEGMCAGLPVVAYGVGAIPELIEPGSTGLLIEAGDVDAVEEACIGLINSPDMCGAIGMAARSAAKERFDFRRYVADLAQALKISSDRA